MKQVKIVALVLLCLVAFLLGRISSNGKEAPLSQVPEEAATKTQMYYCSMHPQIRSPDPNDKCPICFMDLIPLPVDGDLDSDRDPSPRLRLSSAAAALIDLQTWPVARRPVTVELPLYGQVGFDESRIVDVVVRADSYLSKLKLNTPWQPVNENDLLAELYSPAITAAMQEFLVVAKGPQEMLQAARERLTRLGVSKRQIDEILRSKEVPTGVKVFSPISGVGLPSEIKEGYWLAEGESLARLADIRRIWINVEAYERDLHWITEDAEVRFSVAALPAQIFEGKIIFINPVVNEQKRTVQLRIEADNPKTALRPGMFVSAMLKATFQSASTDAHNSSTPPLVIPASAPLITGKRALVYLRLPDEEQPTFEPRNVTLGPRAGDFYVIEDGLKEGELVVTNGQFKIDSELQIRGRPSMMTVDRSGVEKGETPYQLQTHCPIMGGAINRDFYHDHAGQRIYLCCPGCLDEVKKNADKIIEEHRAKGIVFERVNQ